MIETKRSDKKQTKKKVIKLTEEEIELQDE